MTLLVLGCFTIDDVVLPDGTTSTSQCGGNAVYGALGAAIWRSRIGMAARMGPDFPVAHVRELERAGLELHLVPVAAPSIHNWIRYGSDDVRGMGIWDDSGSHADQSIRPGELPPTLEHVDACHVAPMPLAIQVELVRHLRRAGVRLVSLDPHDEHVAGNEDELLALLGEVDLFLPSRAEARLLYGHDDPEAAVRSFVAAGPTAAVIKLGPEGSIVCGPDGVAHQVPAVPARVVDPTGAGDTYCGGFLAAYSRQPDAVAAGRHGAVSASFAVEVRGALGLADVDRAEAERRLAAISASPSPLPSPSSDQETSHAHG